jgi:hypothetical protein
MFPQDKVSDHFTWGECLYLASWNCFHIPTQQEKANIIKTCKVMDKIRDELGRPISVHCFIRPAVVNCPTSPNHGKNYNAFVGGAKNSAHLLGLAVDWSCGENCDLTRAKLLPHLDQFNIRMENLPKASWLHIDLMPPNPNRFFKP